MRIQNLFAALCFVIVSAFSTPAFAQSELQTPRIDSFRPGNFGEDLPPGVLVRVGGAGFARRHDSFSNTTQPYESQAYFLVNDQKIPTQTFVESETRLYFLIPFGAPCGTQFIVITNVNLRTPATTTPFSAPGRINIACVTDQGEIRAPEFTSLEPENADPGDEIVIRGRFYFYSIEYEQSMQLLVGSREMEYNWISSEEIHWQIPANFACNQSLQLKLVQRLFDYSGNDFASEADLPLLEPRIIEIGSEAHELRVVCAGELTLPTDGGTTLNEDDLLDFLLSIDLDDDCTLSDTELFAAVDLWIAGVVDEALFIAAVDLWIEQTKFCDTRAASNNQITLALTGERLLISSEQADGLLIAEVFDASAKRLSSQKSQGPLLVIHLQQANGKPLANGLYWVRVISAGFAAQKATAIYRFVLLR